MPAKIKRVDPKKSTTTKKPAAKSSAVKSPELAKLVESLNKKFGQNAVSLGFPKDDAGRVKGIERLPTGSFSLDLALGGGLPLGRFIHVCGGFSSTKTTQCMHIIRNAQEAGMVCALIDAEDTSDDPYLEALGIDLESLLYSNPDGSEEAFQMILDMQRSGEVHLAVLDSLAALSPIKEQDTSMEDTMRMGIPQQLLGEFLRKYQASNNRLKREGKRPFTLIGINQLREKIGAYGDPEYAPGGKAKDFASTIDLRFRRGDWITMGTGENKEVVGQVVKFRIDKNKTFKRMQSGECDFYFSDNEVGVPIFYNDNFKEVVSAGVEWGVIERSGAWFVYNGKKFQGIGALLSAMAGDTALVEDVKKKVLRLALKKD
jgi:recombination protein RecA